MENLGLWGGKPNYWLFAQFWSKILCLCTKVKPLWLLFWCFDIAIVRLDDINNIIQWYWDLKAKEWISEMERSLSYMYIFTGSTEGCSFVSPQGHKGGSKQSVNKADIFVSCHHIFHIHRHWKLSVIKMLNLSLLVIPDVVINTTSSAANDDKVGIMTILSFSRIQLTPGAPFTDMV